MKSHLPHRAGQKLACIVTLVLTSLLVAHAEPATGPMGHWVGDIVLPGTRLSIKVDLTQDTGAWGGSIDIPAQGLHGFKLSGVKVDGANVGFAMAGIPGDPAFAGKLTADGHNLGGDFTQGGAIFPFTLARKADEKSMKAVPGNGLEGFWQGSLMPSPLIELRLALEISRSGDGKLKGTMTSLDQGGSTLRITTLEEGGGKAHLDVEGNGGAFDGTFNAGGAELAGDWQQGGKKLPLVFKRLEKAARLRRPQVPKKPYPYVAEEVVVENKKADVKLAGTLSLPQGAGPHPVVVLITGSGPQDRDEALMGHRPFLVLADYLTRQGIAVLRCDDRGTAKSTGNFAKATDTDFVEDTLACVEWLKGRKEIDAKRIGLVGHSEGGIVAPRAAVKQPGDIAFIVLLAGVGEPMEDLLIRQSMDVGRAMGLSGADVSRMATAQRESFSLLKQATSDVEAEKLMREAAAREMERFTPEQRKSMGMTDAFISGQAKAAATPWFRQLLVYDPRPTLMAVKCPVLALNGDKDIQVAAKENLAAIDKALRAGGNTQVKTVELPGLNHLFQTCTTGSVAEYNQIEETFSPAALKTVGDWIRERTGL